MKGASILITTNLEPAFISWYIKLTYIPIPVEPFFFEIASYGQLQIQSLESISSEIGMSYQLIMNLKNNSTLNSA